MVYTHFITPISYIHKISSYVSSDTQYRDLKRENRFTIRKVVSSKVEGYNRGAVLIGI